MYSRRQILVYAFSVLFWALPAAAQVEFQGLQLAMSGDVSMGYNGDLSGQGGSDHGLGLGGLGYLSGSYYNPNFLSFFVQPYYNRSQSNSESQSIFDSSGYTGNVSIFGGSHFPGSISFSQAWDSTGLFGIPGTLGFTTKDSNRAFGIGWSELVPGLPSLTVYFSRGSGSSSILGSDVQSDSTTDSFGVRSSYRLAGFNLSGGFIHQSVDTNITGLLTNGEAETTGTSTNSYLLNVSHSFPLHGAFNLSLSKTDYSDSASGVGSNGTTDNAFANLNMQLGKFPITATAAYTDNLYGSFEQQILGNGGTPLPINLSPESRSLLINVSSSYMVMPHVFVTGYVSRQELFIEGQDYGLTQLGASISANLGRRFKGLTVTVGMNDSANQQGNLGAALLANVNYNRNIGHWDFGANFSYDQNVQTLLAIYQTSSMNYTARLQRRFARGLTWSVGGGGGHSGFEQVSGSGNHSEGVNSGLSWRRCTLAGNFSQSRGTSVLTPTGLVAVPLPIISNNLVVFNGQSYGFSFGATPVRAMSLTASYSKGNSNTLAQSLVPQSLTSNNKTELIDGVLTYRYRKVFFQAGVVQFRQGFSASGTLPSVVTSYYFGVSRWLKLF